MLLAGHPKVEQLLGSLCQDLGVGRLGHRPGGRFLLRLLLELLECSKESNLSALALGRRGLGLFLEQEQSLASFPIWFTTS